MQVDSTVVVGVNCVEQFVALPSAQPQPQALHRAPPANGGKQTGADRAAGSTHGVQDRSNATRLPVL